MGESGEYWRDVRAHKKRVKKERMLRDERILKKQLYPMRPRRSRSLLDADVTTGWWLWEMLITPRIDPHSRPMPELR